MSSANKLLIFGLVSCLCLIFFYPKQLNPLANSVPSSIVKNTSLRSNSGRDSPTTAKHLLFGLVGSEKAMHHRKDYIESWWRPIEFRGYVYLDKTPKGNLLPWSSASPPYRVSDNLTEFIKETHAYAPVMIRMAHAIMEIVREERKGFRWLIMGDDDSIFFVDNVVDVLSKYDHTKYYYLGGPSECIITNYGFSFNMGFGGAGLIFSYPLAKALANDMESCLRNYAQLHSADHITMICIADIGVNLTPQKGLHQVDLRGNIFGFLSSHPKTLLMSLHHFDVVKPIFPSKNRVESTRHLMKAANVDQSRLLQQTICYHRQRRWSISISWGYSVHIYEKLLPRSWLQKPIETFSRWGGGKLNPPRYYLFNTRKLSNNSCEAPHIFFFETIKISKNSILASYSRSSSRNLPPCADGNHSANYVSHINVYSPATKRVEANAAVAELYTRYQAKSRVQHSAEQEWQKLMKEMEEAKKLAEAAWKDSEEARAAAVRAQDETQIEKQNALIMLESMKTANVEFAKRRDEEEKANMARACEEGLAEGLQKSQATARAEGRAEGLKESTEAALSRFSSDLLVLSRPVYALGFSQAVDDVSRLLDEQASTELRDHPSYNPRAAELSDQLAEGIKQGADLAMIEEKFFENLEVSVDEFLGSSSAKKDAES